MSGKENTPKKKVVGIIGGMGPAPTAMLFKKMIDYTEAKSDEEHIHIFIDNNPKIPDCTEAIMKGSHKPAKYICESGKKLIECGAELLLLPCDTSHYYYEEIQAELSVPVVNMIRETAEECKKRGYRKVGVLATTGTMAAKTYDQELHKLGIDIMYPDRIGQKKLMDIIYNQVKAGTEIDTYLFYPTLSMMVDFGVEAFILGCTELPMAFHDGDFGYRFLDSLDILAKCAVKKAGYRLKTK